jgi:3-oxoacyl-[acyl-carrier protein] reductase
LSQVEASKTVVNTTLERFGRIDALLNIAGAVPQIDLFEMTDEQWKAGMELKLHGARRLTIRAWDALKQAKGSVVFMSGSAALDPKLPSRLLPRRMLRSQPLRKLSQNKALRTAFR